MESAGSLMQQHAEAIGGACPRRLGGGQEGRDGGIVNQVKDDLLGVKSFGGKKRRIAGFHADGGGVNDEIAFTGASGEAFGVERNARDRKAGGGFA